MASVDWQMPYFTKGEIYHDRKTIYSLLSDI